jgi:hypothetical protein
MLQVKLGDALPDSFKIVMSVNKDLTWDGIFGLLERQEPMVSSSVGFGTISDSGIIKTEPADVNYMQSNTRNDRFPGKCNFCGK